MEVRFAGCEALGWSPDLDLSDPWVQAIDEDMGRWAAYAEAGGWICSAALLMVGAVGAMFLLPATFAIAIPALAFAASVFCGWRAVSSLR